MCSIISIGDNIGRGGLAVLGLGGVGGLVRGGGAAAAATGTTT